MKYPLFFLLCILFSTGLTAQNHTISGTLTDADNGETLFGATVYLDGTSYGATTNAYGFFSLSAPAGDYTLVISYIGYENTSESIRLEADIKVNRSLNEASDSLDEVVINASQSSGINLRSPQMGVNKLTAKTIKQIPVVMGEVDVLKSIQMLPGVTNNGEGSVGFNVRGGAVDQNLVLLDEAIIYNTSHFFGFFSVFNADAIKDINLYKGDIPAKFGGRVSSVLDVRQKDGNNKDFRLTGGIGLISSRLAAEGPLFNDKGSFIVAGRTSYAHLFMGMIEELENSRISFYDLNVKGNYELNDKNRLYLSGYFGRDVFDIDGIVENNYGNVSGNLRWNHIYNDRLFSNLSLIYSKYDYQFIISFLEMDWVADIQNYNLKYDFTYYLSDKLEMDIGAGLISYTLNPGAIKPIGDTSPINTFRLDEQRALEAGAYLSMEHKLTDKLTARYGLRYSWFNRLGGQAMTEYADNRPVVYNPTFDIYESGQAIGTTNYGKNESIQSYGNLEPRLGLAYQLNEQSSLKAGYNRNAQYLHLLSNTTNVTPVDVWTPSGQYIKPQLSDQYSVGYFRTFRERTFGLEVETYYKTVANRIDYIDGATLVGNNNIENEILNGSSRAYGLELLLRKDRGKLTGWVAYTLSKSEQRTPGGIAGGPGINNGDWYNTPHDRTHDISATTTYKLSEKWSLSANAVFQTGRPVTYPTGQYEYEGLSIPHFEDRNIHRLPAYHRLDVAAVFVPRPNSEKRWKGEWAFSIYNLYNRRNAAAVSFGQNRETGINEATRLAIFGMIPSVSYNFKF